MRVNVRTTTATNEYFRPFARTRARSSAADSLQRGRSVPGTVYLALWLPSSGNFVRVSTYYTDGRFGHC